MMPDRPAKPPHMPRLTPYLMVRDPQASLGFYQKAFGFEPRSDMVIKGPDGKIMHAEMAFHDGVIMFGPEGACDPPIHSPATIGRPSPVGLYVYCEDVDALYQRATGAGAKSDMAPQDMFWGDRMCGVTDPDGHRWNFATNVGDFDPTRMPPPGNG
jgi:uncharacterized glyoxalase superfamily protein PhnB